MSIVSDVRFAHEEGILTHTLTELTDIDAKIIRETSTEPGQSAYFLRFDCPSQERLETVLEADPSVRKFTPVSLSVSEQLWYLEFAEDAKLLNPLVADEGGFVLHARGLSVGDDRCGWYERWLLPNPNALNNIWRRARDEEFEFEILHYYPWDGNFSEYTVSQALTDEQRETLVLAYEEGYFTEPRETNLEELAEKLGVSSSAVAGRLKRGMNMLIKESLIVKSEKL